MKEILPGHVYELDNLKSPHKTHLTFHMDPAIHKHSLNGPSTQEVLRACIARVKHLDSEQPAQENPAILRALREAITLFELTGASLKRSKLSKSYLWVAMAT